MLKRIINKFSMDTHFSELIKGSGEAFVIRMIGLIFIYVFTFLMSRQLGAAAVGIFAISLTVLQISSMVARLGYERALLRLIAEYSSKGLWPRVKEIYLKSIRVVVSLGIFLSVLIFLFSSDIAKYIFKKEYLTPDIRLISLGLLPMALLLINAESLRGIKKIKEFSLLENALIYFFATLFLFFFLLTNKSAHNPVIAFLISVIIVSALSFVLWFKKSNILLYKVSNDIQNIDILRISLPLFFASSVLFLDGWIDLTMLGIYLSETDVGIYLIILKISKLNVIVLRSINSIAAPKFSEFYGKGNIVGLRDITRKSTKMIFFGSAPILLLCIIFPSFLLSLFGKEFSTGSLALVIVASGMFFASISGSVGYFLQMTGKQIAYRNIIMCTAILHLGLNILLIPRFGIVGAAISNALAVSLRNIISVLYIKKNFNILTMYIPFISPYIERKNRRRLQ